VSTPVLQIPSDPTQASTFKVARETLITAQRLLLDTGNLTAFHQSIGSLTLLDDYRRWRDRVFINELLKSVIMPTGFVFEGVRFFESTNMPTQTATASIASANASYETAIGMFFGPQSVGVGIGGNNAQVLLNNNDDFSRFIMMIWSLYAGFELLNADFATIAYSFNA
jgi:hypothetical protein